MIARGKTQQFSGGIPSNYEVDECTTAEDGQKIFFQWAQIHHPDDAVVVVQLKWTGHFHVQFVLGITQFDVNLGTVWRRD